MPRPTARWWSRPWCRWTVTVLAVVMFLAFAASMRWLFARNWYGADERAQHGASLTLDNGIVGWIAYTGSPVLGGWGPTDHVIYDIAPRRSTEGMFKAWFPPIGLPDHGPHTVFGWVALWPLVMVLCGLSGWQWRHEVQRRRRERLNLCGCGYARAGAPGDTSCPECGASPPARHP